MTVKLYEQDPYLKQCKSIIIDVIKEKEDFLLVLNQTIFFPEGGGQPSDTGHIDGIKVSYVFEKNNILYHKVDKVPLNKEVLCNIDWDRRLDHMQQHCGEHILSGVFLKYYGLHNKGFHLGEDSITIDIDSKQIAVEVLSDVELKANKVISNNVDITIFSVGTKELAQKYPLRKIPDIENNIRIVKIGEIDYAACCGTHPSKSGDVGLIKILRTQSYKGMTRVFFKCGTRAFIDYQKEHKIVSDLNKKYSSDVNSLPQKMKIEAEKISQIKKELKDLKLQICNQEVEKLLYNEQTDFIYEVYKDKTMEDLQYIAQKIIEKNNYCLLLCSLNEQRIIFIHGGEKDINCGEIFKEHIGKYNGRGGGSVQKAQGVFQNKEDTIKFFELVKKTIELLSDTTNNS